MDCKLTLAKTLGVIYGIAQLGIAEFCLLLTSPCGIVFASGFLTRCIIPKQEPKHLLIGLTGVSLCLTVSSIAIMSIKECMLTSSIVTGIAFCFYPFFFYTFAGGKTFFVRSLTGVKINWLRIICGYSATLPVFLYFLVHPIIGFFLHFGVFYFLIEASLVHKTTVFKEYTECREGRPSVRVGVVEVEEEEKNTTIYKFFEFLRVLT